MCKIETIQTFSKFFCSSGMIWIVGTVRNSALMSFVVIVSIDIQLAGQTASGGSSRMIPCAFRWHKMYSRDATAASYADNASVLSSLNVPRTPSMQLSLTTDGPVQTICIKVSFFFKDTWPDAFTMLQAIMSHIPVPLWRFQIASHPWRRST